MKNKLMLLSALFLTTASWAAQPLTQLSFVATTTAPEGGEDEGTLSVIVHGGVAPYVATVYANGEIVEGPSTPGAGPFVFDLEPGEYYVAVNDSTDSAPHTFLNDQQVLQNIEIPGDLRLQQITPVAQQNFSVQVTNVDTGNNLGAISVNVKGGTPNFTVQLFSSAGGPVLSTIIGTNNRRAFDFLNLQAGSYFVQVLDNSQVPTGVTGLNQSTAQAVTVATCTLDIVDIDVVDVSCTAAGAGGSITVELAGDLNFTVELSGPLGPNSIVQTQQGVNGQTSFTFPNLPAGTYSIRATDSSFCEKIANGIVVGTSTLAFSTTLGFTGTPACSFPAILAVTVTPGVAPFTVRVTGPGGFDETDITVPFTFNLPVAGTYQITVTDANGCVRTGSVVVPAVLAFTTVVTPENCVPGTQNGAIVVTVTGGFPPFTLFVNGVQVGQPQTSPIFVIPNLAAGDFGVVVEDNTGCRFEIDPVTVPLNTLEITSVTTTPQDFCEETGGTITVVVTGGENLTATATSSTGEVFVPTTTVPSGNSTTFTFTDLPAGRFTVTVTNTFDEPNVETCSRSVCAVVSSNNSVLNFLNAKFCGAVC